MKKYFSLLALGIVSMHGYADTFSLSGSGTQDDPFQISTADDFATLSIEVTKDNTGEGYYFKMMNDINFGGSADNPVQFPAIAKAGITSIANVAWGFEGTFDGGNHTLTGIYHTENGNDAAGQFNALFSSLGENATVKNMIFGEENHVSSYNYVGSIASLCAGKIENCDNYADITAANAFAGGICGYMIKGKGAVSNCTNHGAVSAMTYACGIVAGSQSGNSITEYAYIVEDCENNGGISTLNAVGGSGITGSYSGAVTGCVNNGDIDGTAKTTGQYNAGIVATATNLTELSRCENNGLVTGMKNVAGIVAMIMKGDDSEITIENCINNGNIEGEGANIAGIVANTQRSNDMVIIESCTNNAPVSTTDEETDLIGNLRGSYAIALGEYNTIAEGLERYALDPEEKEDSTDSVYDLINNNDGLKDGKYLIDGKIIIVKSGKLYSSDGKKI